jgi:hypothetical protein
MPFQGKGENTAFLQLLPLKNPRYALEQTGEELRVFEVRIERKKGF